MRFFKLFGAAALALSCVVLILWVASRIGSSTAEASIPRQVEVSRPPVPDAIEERYLETMKLWLTRRSTGKNWPDDAETMIGIARLDQLHAAIKTVLVEKIPGDLSECGVWRGGACIFMRAALKAYGVKDRTIWAADSFQGMPPGHGKDGNWDAPELVVSLDKVQANFRRYGLLDDRVQFLKGWFSDTLPKAPIKQLAILRADGDLYVSTMDILNNLYDRVAPGGFIIIDDYGVVDECAKAVREFRKTHGITTPMRQIDWSGVYWRKP